MTRENKAGLVVSGSFLCLLGVVLYARLYQSHDSTKPQEPHEPETQVTQGPPDPTEIDLSIGGKGDGSGNHLRPPGKAPSEPADDDKQTPAPGNLPPLPAPQAIQQTSGGGASHENPPPDPRRPGDDLQRSVPVPTSTNPLANPGNELQVAPAPTNGNKTPVAVDPLGSTPGTEPKKNEKPKAAADAAAKESDKTDGLASPVNGQPGLPALPENKDSIPAPAVDSSSGKEAKKKENAKDDKAPELPAAAAPVLGIIPLAPAASGSANPTAVAPVAPVPPALGQGSANSNPSSNSVKPLDPDEIKRLLEKQAAKARGELEPKSEKDSEPNRAPASVPNPSAPTAGGSGVPPVPAASPSPIDHGPAAVEKPLPTAPTPPPVSSGVGRPLPFQSDRSDSSRDLPRSDSVGATLAPPQRVAEHASPASTSSTPTPRVIQFDEDKYQAERNDNFREISKKFYQGEDKYERALLRFNRDHVGASDALRQDSPVFKGGESIYIPPIAVLIQKYGAAYPELAPARTPSPAVSIRTIPEKSLLPQTGASTAALAAPTPPPGVQLYRVRANGEMFWTIARNTLGSGERWTEIYQLNSKYDPRNPIPENTTIYLPANARVDSNDTTPRGSGS